MSFGSETPWKERFGRETWSVMHTYLGSKMPENRKMQLLHLLVQHYPCDDCRKSATGFLARILCTNPLVDAEHAAWLLHNMVNHKLGKDQFHG